MAAGRISQDLKAMTFSIFYQRLSAIDHTDHLLLLYPAWDYLFKCLQRHCCLNDTGVTLATIDSAAWQGQQNQKRQNTGSHAKHSWSVALATLDWTSSKSW